MSYRESRVGQQQTAKILSNPSDSPAQRRVRLNLDDTSAAWTALPKSKKLLWESYGATQRRKDPVTARSYRLTGRECFMGLNSRFALINPGAALPTDPPTVRFGGDTLLVTAQPGEKAGTVEFVASAPNKVGVETELMGVRLASADRSPQKADYVALAFVAFNAGDGNSAEIDLLPGAWALAYRFVSPVTGEAKPIVELGTLTVGLSLVQGGIDDADEAPAPRKAPARKAA